MLAFRKTRITVLEARNKKYQDQAYVPARKEYVRLLAYSVVLVAIL